MHRVLRFFGVFLILEGVTGVVNQAMGGPPFFVFRLFDHYNRLVVHEWGSFTGWEIVANGSLAIMGAAAVTVAWALRSTDA
ncbi:hypothetical protein [Sinosporangium siamense]|uniref:Uncharacterized protein n=1 Tax=Sinosporangium siamense TaxID=1367973 RepID=A0A919RIS2_9ACTN|nr:hypothetical protein [Sinosporangium siamense]GII94567.1 hypothetical protein Ssi02_47980 [Sinosporangium siamense]